MIEQYKYVDNVDKYMLGRLKVLASLCLEKNIYTEYNILFKFNTIKRYQQVGWDEVNTFFFEIKISKRKKEISFNSYGENPYPLDRIINFIGGLK